MSSSSVVRFVHNALDRCEPITDRVNPILVKEARQFLRGKGFVWSFIVMVVLAAAIGAIFLVMDERSPSDALGLRFLSQLLGVLGVGMLIIVPLQTFQSLGAEWEGETMEQLALSGLTPGQIVSGKLQWAALQSLLLLAAFAPFIALGFLMRGIDLYALLVAVVVLWLFSVWGASAALAISSLTKQRVSRGVMFVGAAMGLFASFGGAMASVSTLISEPSLLRQTEFLAVMASALIAGTCVMLFCHFFACGRLAHPEENASTPLRLMTLVSTLLVFVWCGIAAANRWLPPPAYFFFLSVLTVVLGVLGTLWATERPRLGRRVANDLARRGSRTRRVPGILLPGGGRGILFGFVTVALGAIVTLVSRGSGEWGFDDSRWFGVWVFCYYSFYVGVPTALFSRLCKREIGTWITRLVVALSIGAGVVLPSIIGLLSGDRDLSAGRQAFNMFWVLMETMSGDLTPNIVASVFGLGLLGALVSLPRIVTSMIEVAHARAGRTTESDPALLRSRERALAES